MKREIEENVMRSGPFDGLMSLGNGLLILAICQEIAMGAVADPHDPMLDDFRERKCPDVEEMEY